MSYFLGSNKATTVAHSEWTDSMFSSVCLYVFYSFFYSLIRFCCFLNWLKPSIETPNLWNCERRPIIKWEQPLFYIHVSHFRSKFMAVRFSSLFLLCVPHWKWLPNQFPLDVEQFLLLRNVTKNGISINFFIACLKHLIMLAVFLHYHFVSAFLWSKDLIVFELLFTVSKQKKNNDNRKQSDKSERIIPLVCNWFSFFLLSYTFWLCSHFFALLCLALTFDVQTLRVRVRWWNELFLKRKKNIRQTVDARATVLKTVQTASVLCMHCAQSIQYVFHSLVEHFFLPTLQRFTWYKHNECGREREREKATSLLHSSIANQTKPNQGEYNTMTNKPSVKQQHIRPNWCLCGTKSNWHENSVLHSTLSSSMTHDTHRERVYWCVPASLPAVCVCAFLRIHVNIPRHKYAMDIIELAIKRKAKWISKARITYRR